MRSLVRMTLARVVPLALVGQVACQSAAVSAADRSGVYGTEGVGLTVLQGAPVSVVEMQGGFPTPGGSVSTCECTFVATADGPDRWKLTGGGDGTLEFTGSELRLQLKAGACCGLSFPGEVRVPAERTGGLRECVVKAPKAFFHRPGQDLRPDRTTAYVVAGDHVQAAPGSPQPGFMPARFVGARSTTAGLLARPEVDCGAGATKR